VGSSFQHDANSRANEREIIVLSDRNGVSETDVRTLFAAEFARLKMGAKVSSYLTVLTTSSVRGMLQRKAARVAAAADGALR
jgi:hypothetical protein